ncbi:MAG: di-heme oxidoredictase family protein [Deltaproteobacteria bacterium]|jgi:CxxC motif-containing protein (DUF1111 family)
MRRALGLLLLVGACSGEEPAAPAAADPYSGGAATVFDDGPDAYSRNAPGLERDAERTFFKGRALFRDPWVTAPASTETRDGLGPLFNARSCEQCHVRDGRGQPPALGEPMETMLLRLSVSSGEPEPTYGGQLQPYAVLGVPAEGTPVVAYETTDGTYGDGTAYTLQKPTFTIDALGYGPLADDVLVSPRVAPVVYGLGLLEAVPAEDIYALEDPDDADGDGISGRANVAYDRERDTMALGRFGWKGGQPTIRQQSAAAFLGDIGITSSLFADGECTAAQAPCSDAISGGDPELLDVILDNVTDYGRLLAVPARRDVDDPQVLRGEALFTEAGCAACHVATLTTHEDADFAVLAGQTIHPYSDLLLHDMGPGLADDRPEAMASGTEWRTPPLWGIGLLETVNRHTKLLHDGRAATFEEAILWHGGEAETSKEVFRNLGVDDRAAIVSFLGSL